jgi:hypothetical protein
MDRDGIKKTQSTRRNGFSAAITMQILLQIKSSRIKEKWFAVMAKPSCVVLHMVASNQKDGGRWR